MVYAGRVIFSRAVSGFRPSLTGLGGAAPVAWTGSPVTVILLIY